jgi:hypothetical protein
MLNTLSPVLQEQFLRLAETATSEGKTFFIFEGKRYAIVEGLVDRLKSRVSGAHGAAKGVSKQVHGAALTARGTFSGNTKDIQKGLMKIRGGSISGQLAQNEKYKNLLTSKLDAVIKEITTDMEKLDITFQKTEKGDQPSASAEILERYKKFKGEVLDVFADIEHDLRLSVKDKDPVATP